MRNQRLDLDGVALMPLADWAGVRSSDAVPPARGTVFVVDDDPGTRKALRSLIGSVGLAVQTLASADEFLEAPPHQGPCCLVLDLHLPGLSGLELQSRMAELHREIPIIFVTGHGDVPTSVQAMKAGALEFLTKPVPDKVLLQAIFSALESDRRERERRSDLDELDRRYASLTRREREVMTLVVSGLANKQIAARLGTSTITVKVHRGKVMHKMRASSLPDLVRMGERLGLDEKS